MFSMGAPLPVSHQDQGTFPFKCGLKVNGARKRFRNTTAYCDLRLCQHIEVMKQKEETLALVLLLHGFFEFELQQLRIRLVLSAYVFRGRRGRRPRDVRFIIFDFAVGFILGLTDCF